MMGRGMGADRRPLPPLHAVTDGAVLARADFERVAGEVMAVCGARVAVHVRGPRVSGRRVYEVAARLAEIARTTGALVIVNDRVDLALAAGADGVQLGRRGIAIADARAVAGGGTRIGASVHGVEEGREAVDAGAEWLLAGSIYPTGSHPGQPGAGPGLIGRMVALGRPVIGIGGITPERAREVRGAGAAGVAAIRGIWEQPSPARAARAYIEAWQS